MSTFPSPSHTTWTELDPGRLPRRSATTPIITLISAVQNYSPAVPATENLPASYGIPRPPKVTTLTDEGFAQSACSGGSFNFPYHSLGNEHVNQKYQPQFCIAEPRRVDHSRLVPVEHGQVTGCLLELGGSPSAPTTTPLLQFCNSLW